MIETILMIADKASVDGGKETPTNTKNYSMFLSHIF